MDNNQGSFTFSGRIRSVKHATDGIIEMVRGQQNAWVHLVATILVIIGGFVLDVSRVDWIILILAIVSVWVAEVLNTAFEFLCDVASPEFHPVVKKSKDVAAGAVLIAALGAVLIGVIVFSSYIL